MTLSAKPPLGAHIEYAAAALAARVPDLALEGTLNRQITILGIMQPAVEQVVAEKTEELRQLLWTAGVCADCKSEIQHDITEPFAQCECPGAFGESTVVPTIAGLRYDGRQKDAALWAAYQDLVDAASGHAPYPWTHEDNPYHETIMKLRKELKMPDVQTHDSNTDTYNLPQPPNDKPIWAT